MSGAVIKRIAVITMLIDHIAAAFFYIFTSRYGGAQAFAGADMMYDIFRMIGRTSFPLFCFLLVEGFLHTKSLRRYLARIFVFAMVSETAFDLAFFDRVRDTEMQNVFFTLFFGLLAIAFLRWGLEKPVPKTGKIYMLLGIMGALCCAGAAHHLRTDYGAKGVLLIVVLYVLRNNRLWACISGYVTMCVFMRSSWSFPAFYLINAYNGKRGKGAKYFFYVFYPAHLLLLAGIRILYLKG